VVLDLLVGLFDRFAQEKCVRVVLLLQRVHLLLLLVEVGLTVLLGPLVDSIGGESAQLQVAFVVDVLLLGRALSG